MIVGSALVRHLADFATRPRDEVVQGIAAYVGELAAALKHSTGD